MSGAACKQRPIAQELADGIHCSFVGHDGRTVGVDPPGSVDLGVVFVGVGDRDRSGGCRPRVHAGELADQAGRQDAGVPPVRVDLWSLCPGDEFGVVRVDGVDFDAAGCAVVDGWFLVVPCGGDHHVGRGVGRVGLAA